MVGIDYSKWDKLRVSSSSESESESDGIPRNTASRNSTRNTASPSQSNSTKITSNSTNTLANGNQKPRFTDLSFDILEQITLYLDLKTYTFLRISCKSVYEKLGKVPTIELPAFLQTVNHVWIAASFLSECIHRRPQPHSVMKGRFKLPTKSFSEMAFCSLIMLGFHDEALRLLASPRATEILSVSTLNKCLEFTLHHESDKFFDSVYLFWNKGVRKYCRGFVQEVRRQHWDGKLPLALVHKIGVENVKKPNLVFDVACDENEVALAKLFIKDVHADYESFLVSCEEGQAELVALFLSDTSVDPSREGNDALYTACTEGHTEVVRILLADPRVLPNEMSNQCIGVASEYGYIEIVDLLIQDPRVDPSDDNNYAFRLAIKSSNDQGNTIAILQLLLTDPRVSYTNCKKEIIEDAVSHGYEKVLSFLMTLPLIDMETYLDDALVMATKCGHDAVVKVLLNHPRTNPNHYFYRELQRNPLYLASRKNYTSIVKILLNDKRSDPIVGNSAPLRIACHYNRYDIAKLLCIDGRSKYDTCVSIYFNFLFNKHRFYRISRRCDTFIYANGRI